MSLTPLRAPMSLPLKPSRRRIPIPMQQGDLNHDVGY